MLPKILEIVNNYIPNYAPVYLVGSTALSPLICCEPRKSDLDLLVTRITNQEIRQKIKEDGVHTVTTYFGGVRFCHETQQFDIWSDNVEEYLKAVPWPINRIAVNVRTGSVLIGDLFMEHLYRKIIEIPYDKPQGRIGPHNRMVSHVLNLAAWTKFSIGPNLDKWIKHNAQA